MEDPGETRNRKLPNENCADGYDVGAALWVACFSELVMLTLNGSHRSAASVRDVGRDVLGSI